MLAVLPVIGGKKTYEPDWRPTKRVKNRKGIDAKKTPKCRICRQDGLTPHHLVNRSQGGDDVPSNIVWLCGHGTAGCHGLVTANDKNARAQLRGSLQPDEIGYIIAKKSTHWLNKHYPVGSSDNKKKSAAGKSA